MAWLGRIEVICGPMFGGKTEELIRRVRRAQFAKQSVQVFKPSIDNRYDALKVVSHAATAIEGIPVENSAGIRALANALVVAIDEVQFFDEGVVEVCDELARAGTRVVVAGLDRDSFGRPFGPVPQLLAIAEQVTKVCAVCVQCGEDATMSFRLHKGTEQVVVGGASAYEPRCRLCYVNS